MSDACPNVSIEPKVSVSSQAIAKRSDTVKRESNAKDQVMENSFIVFILNII